MNIVCYIIFSVTDHVCKAWMVFHLVFFRKIDILVTPPNLFIKQRTTYDVPCHRLHITTLYLALLLPKSTSYVPKLALILASTHHLMPGWPHK